MTYCYEYPRPMYTTDAVVFSVLHDALHVLVVLRKNAPYAGCWALPGGFLDMDESLEACVARELEEETGIRGIRLEQLHTFGDPGRDPRGRSVSTAYVALIDASRYAVAAADDAADAAWRPVRDAHGLAFDHDKMVACAVARLRIVMQYAGLGAQVLPEVFSAEDLHRLYRAIADAPVPREGLLEGLEARGIVLPARELPGCYRFAEGRVAGF